MLYLFIFTLGNLTSTNNFVDFLKNKKDLFIFRNKTKVNKIN